MTSVQFPDGINHPDLKLSQNIAVVLGGTSDKRTYVYVYVYVCVCVCACERQTERQRQRERQTDRQTETETDRDRQTDRDGRMQKGIVRTCKGRHLRKSDIALMTSSDFRWQTGVVSGHSVGEDFFPAVSHKLTCLYCPDLLGIP